MLHRIAAKGYAVSLRRQDGKVCAEAILLTDPAQRHISHQFQNNTVAKEYLAIVAGRPSADEGTVDAPLAPHPNNPKLMAVSKQGRPALTQWKVEQRFRNHTLIRCFPKTGKTHQIRVHLKAAGLPLAVDPLYNPPARGSRKPRAA